MPNPKLFLYKARDANVAVILRRGERRSLWEMIRWDIETDTFTRGQWLTKGVMMNGAYCAISPDGRHFAYWYSELQSPDFTTHAVISEVPYFTALLYTKEHAGMWDTLAFNAQGQPMHTSGRLVKRNPTSLKQGAWERSVDSGYRTNFMDFRGRHITTDKGRLLAGGQLLYDTTDHEFRELKYVSGGVAELPTEKREEVWQHYTEGGQPRARRIYFPAEMEAPAKPAVVAAVAAPRRSARLAAR